MWVIVQLLTLLIWLALLTWGARGAPLPTDSEDRLFMSKVRHLLPVLTKYHCSCPLAHGQRAERSDIVIHTAGSESTSPKCWYRLEVYTCATKHQVVSCKCNHHNWTLPVGKLGQGETDHRLLGVRDGVRFSYSYNLLCNGDHSSCYHDAWLMGYRVQDNSYVQGGSRADRFIRSDFDVAHQTTWQETKDSYDMFRPDPDALYPAEEEKPVVHDTL